MKNTRLLFFTQIGVLFTLVLLFYGCSSGPHDEDEQLARQAEADDFPAFPWPPPQASASVVIPLELVTNSKNKITRLGDINETLLLALETSGYVEKSYFAVPGGYALVTRLEQINIDGTPREPGRWSTEIEPLRRFSLREYLRALFFANTGFYRIVVFVVTPQPFHQSGIAIDRDEAMDWLRTGLNKLPSSVTTQEYTDDFTSTALIYEFERPEAQMPRLLLPSRLTGRDHLDGAGLMSMLER